MVVDSKPLSLEVLWSDVLRERFARMAVPPPLPLVLSVLYVM